MAVGSEIWFTADTHFGHRNIIRLCERPFSSLEEMDETLIHNWNSRVGNNDEIYVVGDFSYRGDVGLKATFNRLKGKKHLVVGNHDSEEAIGLDWESVSHRLMIRRGDYSYLLHHWPEREWDGFYKGTYHVFGHVHGRIPGFGRSVDAGVDAHGYFPVHSTRIRMLGDEQEKTRPYNPQTLSVPFSGDYSER